MDRGGAELRQLAYRSRDSPASRADEHTRGFARSGALSADSSFVHCQSAEHPAIVDAVAWAIRSGNGFGGAPSIGPDLWGEDSENNVEPILMTRLSLSGRRR